MTPNYNNKLIIVISSPSGAGKTSVCQKLIQKDQNIVLSISDTTRPARDNETNGVDYNFIDESEFKERITNDMYIEYANVFGNFYGSQRNNIIDNFKKNKDVLFDIDWQGAKQLKKSSFPNIVSIFLVPPSKNSIYERLKSRATQSGDDEKAINNRMKQYETEMSHRDEYNHIVINDNFENCISEIESIINQHREKIK
tara:strand:- start:800 stop:1393 length:594 start_codon:yes stop_codon:yes gene_type:complete